jgi:hypothetical protein
MRFPGHLGEVSSQFLRLREISTDARFFSIFTRFCKREWGYGGNAVAKGQLPLQEYKFKISNTGDTEEHRGLLLPVLAVDHSLDSVLQVQDVEVDQKAHVDSAQAYVGEELRFVDRVDGFDGFHFDNDTVLNN